MTNILLLTCVDLAAPLPSRSHWIARHYAERGAIRVGSIRVSSPESPGVPARVRHWARPDTVTRFEYGNVPVVCVEVPFGPFSRLGAIGDVRAIRALRRAASAHDMTFDVCIAEEPWAGVAALQLRKTGVVKRVVYDDVDSFAEFLPARRAVSRRGIERLEREAITGADEAVAVSRPLVERASGLGVRARWIPNGVAWSGFKAPDALPPPLSCVYVGSLQPWSGVAEAVEAVGSLVDDGYPATLAVYGPGDAAYLERLQDRVRDRGWADAISINEPIEPSELPAALCGKRIGLVTRVPSRLTAHMFPLKIPEYWAAGLGVVGTDVGEMGRLLRESPAGRPVAHHPQEIAAAILELSEWMTLDRMRQTREAARKYDWGALLGRLDGMVVCEGFGGGSS